MAIKGETLPSIEDLAPGSPAKRQGRRRRLREYGILFGALACLALLGLCKFEILWTSGGPLILKKDRFTLSESFVSLDALNAAGTVEAAQKWPITFLALQRDGIVKLRPKIITERSPASKTLPLRP
jgi:hypothetical protein